MDFLNPFKTNSVSTAMPLNCGSSLGYQSEFPYRATNLLPSYATETRDLPTGSKWLGSG